MVTCGRILVIRLGSLGDVVFTLPAVQALRESFPEARIAYLTYREFVPVLEGFKDVETVLELDRAGYKKLNPTVLIGGTLSLLSKLMLSNFDLAVDFQGFGETAWFTRLSGAPERWGNVYNPGRRWAYTKSVQRNAALHPAEYNLELIRQAGGLARAAHPRPFQVPEAAMEKAQQCFREFGLDPDRPTMLLQPFTSSPSKNWQLDKYLDTARHWRDSGMQILFGGGPADCEVLEPARQAGFAVAAGTPLMVSAGLAKLSTLVLGADTGLLHLAVAMGKRVVMLIAGVQPGATYPVGHPEWTVVPPSGPLVADIPTRSVWDACDRALSERGLFATAA